MDIISTPFCGAPKGSVISYQSPEYEKLDDKHKPAEPVLPSLPLGILDNVPCVYDIRNDQQKLALDKLRISLDEAQELEQNTKQQSSSAQWQALRSGRVTASRFGDVLLR